MAKFSGYIGYAVTENEGHGVWKESVIEKKAYGDIIKNYKNWNAQDNSVNDDISISNSISIVADAYAANHFFAIRYVIWLGTKWKVTSVEVQRPRLILQLGGIYNEEPV